MEKMANSSTSRTSIMGFTATFNAAKILLSIISISSFEPLSNNFRSEIDKVPYTKNEFLHFTNISLIYTIFCVFIGLIKDWSPAFNQLYKFILPTSIVLEMMVTLLFWSLFLINPGLVKCTSFRHDGSILSYSGEFPKHLFPLVILLMEQCGMDLRKAWEHRIFLIFFSIAYFILAETLIIRESNYLYPFLRHFTLRGRTLFFTATMITSIVFYEAWMEFRIPAIRLTRYIKNKRQTRGQNK